MKSTTASEPTLDGDTLCPICNVVVRVVVELTGRGRGGRIGKRGEKKGSSSSGSLSASTGSFIGLSVCKSSAVSVVGVSS